METCHNSFSFLSLAQNVINSWEVVILSFVAMGIVFPLLGFAASLTNDALRIFLHRRTFKIPRFLFVGIVVGYIYKRLYGSESLRQSGKH